MIRPRRARCAALALAAVATAAAGCASGPGTYSLGKTRKCLAKEGVTFRRLTARADFVASLASGGALALKLPSNAVTLTFGKDSQEATTLAAGYRRLGSFATVDTDRNVVVVWTATPSDQEQQKVTRCLS